MEALRSSKATIEKLHSENYRLNGAHVGLCVSMQIRIHVSIPMCNVHPHVYAHALVCMPVYTHACTCVRMHVCTRPVHTYTHMRVRKSTHMPVHVPTSVPYRSSKRL